MAGKKATKAPAKKKAVTKSTPRAKAKSKASGKLVRQVAKSATKSTAKAKKTKSQKPQNVVGMTLAVTGYVAPPPPPPPPPQKAELAALRDIGRLLRYGEVFGANRIEVVWLPVALPVSSGEIAIADAGDKKSARTLDRKISGGVNLRCMLSIAKGPGGERLAAAVIHCGRPPIARWSVAHYAGTKPPKTLDDMPMLECKSGWFAVCDTANLVALGDSAPLPVGGFSPTNQFVQRSFGTATAFAFPVKPGRYPVYWAVDPADKAVCLVIDFEVFTAKEWKTKA